MRAVARPCQNTIQHVELAAVTLIQYSPDHRDGTCKKNRKKEGIHTEGKSKGSIQVKVQRAFSHSSPHARHNTRGGQKRNELKGLLKNHTNLRNPSATL